MQLFYFVEFQISFVNQNNVLINLRLFPNKITKNVGYFRELIPHIRMFRMVINGMIERFPEVFE